MPRISRRWPQPAACGGEGDASSVVELALVAAVGALVVSVVFAVGHGGPGRAAMMSGTGRGGSGPGMMSGTGLTGGPGMMGPGMMGGPGGAMMAGGLWLAGDGTRVASIAGARDRAATAATSAGLHPGEVIWFDNGFYVELKDAAGNPATEVIVDPATGAVSTEPGPAMMWNTRYGAHRRTAPAGRPAVDADRAGQIATGWLAANLPGRLAAPPDAYPGYYTVETTTADGTVNGMLSVNATTGQVWYHTWHGRFIDKQDS